MANPGDGRGCVIISASLRGGLTTGLPCSAKFNRDRDIAVLIGSASRAQWFRRKPRGHSVEFECLDPAAWPENEADDPHVLVPAESMVVALTNAVKVDRDRRAAVGRFKHHHLVSKVNPKDPALDDQRLLWHGRRLGRRL